MNRDPELPPPLEMVCLTALWRIGEGNVEDVRRAVIAERTLAYTTILTLLDRLTRRGAVVRRKEGRAFRYRPSVERDAVRRRALVAFLDSHFDGSITELQSFLNQPAPEPAPAPAAEAVVAPPVAEESSSAVAGSA